MKGPLRAVVRIGEVKRKRGDRTPKWVIELECGHVLRRQTLRLGYNRERDDRAHCIKCSRRYRDQADQG